MKKVVFKWVTTVIDYTSEIEAKKDIERMKQKGSVFVQDEGWTSNPTFAEQGQEQCYTVHIQTPYGSKYNPGF